jgi:O-antigen/teichoic acid export membrane protein
VVHAFACHGRRFPALVPRLSILRTRPGPEGEQRNPLPEGTLAVGAGLLVSGVSAYAFLKIARDALGGTESDASLSLTLLWFLTFILAPGFFLPLEQEVGRALAHRRALGQGSRPIIAKAAVLGIALAAVLVVVTAASAPVTSDQLFHGSLALSGCLALAIVGYGLTHFTRGVLSGSDEFGRYGFLLGADGALRVAGCVVLAVAGVEVAGWYGLLVGLPPLVAAALAVRGRRNLLTPGPAAKWSELTPNLGWLLAGSFLAASLVNAGPLAAKLIADDSQKELVNHFSAGVLISRIPLFLFQAVQAALLPKLAKLAATGEYGAFREGFRRLLIVVTGVGVLGTVGAAAVGPIAIKVFNAELGRRDLTLLALGSAIYMLAVALAQALIALHHHAKVAAGWLTAMVMFAAVTAVGGDDLLLRVELALVVGPVAALAMFGVALRTALAKGEGPDADSLHLALHEIPYEP